MNREIAENAIKDFNYFVDRKMEERITSGQQVTDTMVDIQNYVREIEPEWLEKNKEILPEINEASDREFLDLCKYAMLHNSGAMPTLIEEGLKARGKASEEFLSAYLESPVLELDVNSSGLTQEQIYETDMVNAAIYLSGQMISTAMYKKLADLFKSCLTANEMFLERIVTAMSHKEALPYIKEMLAEEDMPYAKRADLMQMVCNCGEKSDELYKLMKQNFKALAKEPTTEIVGAMLMYDYGDPRIVPAMRKLAIEKIEAAGIVKKDNTPVYILLSMINKLGGNTADLTGGKNLFN